MIMERFKKAANIQRGAKYKGGLDKLPAEAEIFTSETFRYEAAKPGDYVVEAVVDEAINCLPPAFLSSACAQMGCPYSHREDPKTAGGVQLTLLSSDAPMYLASGNTVGIAFRARRWNAAKIRSAAERLVL